MAKFILVIEDAPNGQVAVNCMRQAPVGETLNTPSNAAKAVHAVRLKLVELFAAGAAERANVERAEQCCH